MPRGSNTCKSSRFGVLAITKVSNPKPASPLSAREKEVLILAATGLTDKEIAVKIDIGIATVRTYWDRIRTKLNAVNRTHAVRLSFFADATDTHREMARLQHGGIEDKEIATRLDLSALQLGAEWSALQESVDGISRNDAVSLIIGQLVLEARAALAARSSELALIVCAPEDRAIITFNVMGIITGISRHCERLLGLPSKRLIGMPVDVILKGGVEEVERSSQEMGRAEEGDYVRTERLHTRPDGTSFKGEHSLVAIVGDQGQVTGFVRQITDLTRRRVHQVKIDELNASIALLIHE